MSQSAAKDILNDSRCRCRWPNLGTCNFCRAQQAKSRQLQEEREQSEKKDKE